jgi:hypothetical protein
LYKEVDTNENKSKNVSWDKIQLCGKGRMI